MKQKTQNLSLFFTFSGNLESQKVKKKVECVLKLQNRTLVGNAPEGSCGDPFEELCQGIDNQTFPQEDNFCFEHSSCLAHPQEILPEVQLLSHAFQSYFGFHMGAYHLQDLLL